MFNSAIDRAIRVSAHMPVELRARIVGTHRVNGAFTWTPPSLGGFLLQSLSAPFVLWNFPDTTALTVTGSNTVEGTLYAPRASVTDLNPGNIQGNVIAASFQQGAAPGGANGGEVHDFPFVGDINCGRPKARARARVPLRRPPHPRLVRPELNQSHPRGAKPQRTRDKNPARSRRRARVRRVSRCCAVWPASASAVR